MLKKQKKKLSLLISAGVGVIGATSIISTTALSLSSCSVNEYDKSIAKQLKTSFDTEYANAMGNQMYYQLTKENQPKVISVTQNYISKVNSAITGVGNKFGIDEQIWLRSFLFYLQTKLKLLQANVRYIIVNDSELLTFTNYSKSFQNAVSKAASNYYQKSNPLSVTDVKNNLNGIIQYITDVHNNLKDGLASGVTWSGVWTKHTIGSMLQQLYPTELTNFASGSLDSLTNNLKGSLFTNDSNYLKWVEQIDESDKSSISSLVNAAQSAIDNLTNFLTNDYFNGINYGNMYASTKMNLNFSVVSSNPNEEDNGFIYKNGTTTKYISGLGLSTNDLNVKDIGIGFSGETGAQIYKGLLQKHTNIENVDTTQQYSFGVSQVNDILNAMNQVANKIADLKAGTNVAWEETFMYDADASGDNSGSESTTKTIRNASGTIDLPNFFMWLNSDQWFNGRDMTSNQFPTLDGTNILNAKGENNNASNKKPYQYKGYWTSTDLVASIIGYQGDTDANKTTTYGRAGNLYVKYITNGLSPATIQTSNTITHESMNNDISPAAAYIGASRMIYQYLTYKASVTSHITSAFKNTPAYWTLRTRTGGAASASSGEGNSNWVDDGIGGFYLDVNPYFGLQKWSMSTLTNHEAVSGHVFQKAYSEAHPSDEDAIELKSTAYSEGWGLFSEWLPTQMGIYGEPTVQASATLDNNNNIATTSNMLTLPKFGVNSKTTNITWLSDDYANGAYSIIDKSSNAENTIKANNQTYYDALQYFGFLNERQLRAMRVTVDVGIHAGENGEFKPGTGYSLNQARAYLRSNSGLGIDDVNRETKRYLEHVGQATSYYNGLDKMQSYFLKAKTLFEKANPNTTYMSWQDPSSTQANTEGLFDLLLRNGGVQLPALTWAVDKYLSELYS